ncbi:hypothetical protein HID58_076278, partial [Brassica napus]
KLCALEIPRWGGDESSNKICFDNQTCNVSDFFISDVLIASLPFDESGNNDAFTEITPCLISYSQSSTCYCLTWKMEQPTQMMSSQMLTTGLLSITMTSFWRSTGQDHTTCNRRILLNLNKLMILILSYYKKSAGTIGRVSSYWPRDTLRKKDVTLVLDLDETLVHSTLESCSGADFSFRVFFNMQENTVYVKQRPHLYKFLERVVELFHVVIFTASHSIYASQLLDILDPDGKFISQRFYRDSCILSEGIYTPRIKLFWVLIWPKYVIWRSAMDIDYFHSCLVYRLQINNGIPIKSWYDDPTDDGLITTTLPPPRDFGCC